MDSKLQISDQASQFLGHIKISCYPDEVKGLQNPAGFNALVQFIYHNSKKFEYLCYEEAESIFEHYFGQRKYEDYNSYKSSLHQIMTRARRKKAKPQPLPLFTNY